MTTTSSSRKIPAATPPIIAPVSEQETIGEVAPIACVPDVVVTEQSQPVNPGAQLHLKSSGRFSQVPPFVHGLERQLLRSVSQFSP